MEDIIEMMSFRAKSRKLLLEIEYGENLPLNCYTDQKRVK